MLAVAHSVEAGRADVHVSRLRRVGLSAGEDAHHEVLRRAVDGVRERGGGVGRLGDDLDVRLVGNDQREPAARRLLAHAKQLVGHRDADGDHPGDLAVSRTDRHVRGEEAVLPILVGPDVRPAVPPVRASLEGGWLQAQITTGVQAGAVAPHHLAVLVDQHRHCGGDPFERRAGTRVEDAIATTSPRPCARCRST